MKVLGYIFIALGVLGGIISFASFDFDEYGNAKYAADTLRSNELAQEEYAAQQVLLTAKITESISIALICVTIGIFLLAIDRIIDILKNIERSVSGAVAEDERPDSPM